MRIKLGVILFAALAHALPTELNDGNICQSSNTVVDATFDNIKDVAGNALNPIPVPYEGMDFQAFTAVNTISVNVLPGILPHSGTQYAGAGVVSETTMGTAMLTTNYAGNNNRVVFDFLSFYFACVLQAANAVTGLPTACNIAIAGYRGSDNSVSNAVQVCSEMFQYSPSTMTGPQQMSYSGPVSSQCTDINFLIMTFTLPGGTSALSPDLALVIDDPVYRLKTLCSS